MSLQPALARQDDRNQPIHVVHADSFDGYNQPNTVSTFTGNVLITQGTMKLTGEVAKIYTAKEDTSVDHIIVTGTPQKRPHIEQIDDNGNLMTGDADQLYYDNVNGIAILTGNAFVHQQNKGDAHGAKLTYNTQTNYMVGESNGAGPVTMTFLPKQKPLPPPKHGAAPATPPTPAKPAPGAGKPASSSSTRAPASASSASKE
ncbi:MAG TPA: lipopolysaccharide transport periplasmic protein LptA [Dyella sp.]|uniref:lipopolysaccharide transport periplasmic protein LptA n=1 Tax=Dyella sp. TaxID=1869338 RepID=UPI002B7BAFCE|nr:lipopolysaccharide transport periplasmic protein LptA [Dyella sp.]HUB91719.1 lipopolysaccharide transport periplasmic protein LptA [Dyella sp.]